jgi:hypothetical protein
VIWNCLRQTKEPLAVPHFKNISAQLKARSSLAVPHITSV